MTPHVAMKRVRRWPPIRLLPRPRRTILSELLGPIVQRVLEHGGLL